MYEFVFSSPATFIDPTGLAPSNKHSANRKKAHAALKKHRKKKEKERGKDNVTTTGTAFEAESDMKAGDYSMEGVRYLYTEEDGWIDLLHFFAAFRAARKYGSVCAAIGGWLVELDQWVAGDSSGAPLGGNEDLRSNDSGIGYADEVDDSKPFEDDVLDYIEEKHGKIVEPPRVNEKDKKGRSGSTPQTDSRAKAKSGKATASGATDHASEKAESVKPKSGGTSPSDPRRR